MELTAETPPPRMTYLKVFAIEVKKSLRFASSQFFFCVSRVTLDDGVFGFVGYCDWPDPFYWVFFFFLDFGLWRLFWETHSVKGIALTWQLRSPLAIANSVVATTTARAASRGHYQNHLFLCQNCHS